VRLPLKNEKVFGWKVEPQPGTASLDILSPLEKVSVQNWILKKAL